MNIYAIKDHAIEAFNRPFFLPADGSAIRAFQDEINNEQGELYKHPEDYELYKIGIYNEQTAEIGPQKPQLLAAGADMVYRNK